MKKKKFQKKSVLFVSKYLILCSNMYEQLERLNAESAARTKRERRRANEIKTRAIQRMQLQMIAPLDIGLEQHDAALSLGQEDVFDLGRTENGLGKSSSARFLTDDDDLILESDEEGEEGDEQDHNAGAMDVEEEREAKLRNLEVELDGLYDAYQERLRERDAKFKVNEARRKNAEREEWNGIQEQTDESDSEEGGWDRIQDAKINDDNSSSGDSDLEDTSSITGNKRKSTENTITKPSKRPRLITDLKQPTSGKTADTAAQVWFSQDVFTGLEDLNGLSDSDGADIATDNDDHDTSDDYEDEENVSNYCSNISYTLNHFSGFIKPPRKRQ